MKRKNVDNRCYVAYLICVIILLISKENIMTRSEMICNELGAKFFCKDFVYENLKYFNSKNNRVELCDGLFEYLNIYVALQVKERNTNNQGKSNNDWLNDVVYGEASNQIKETIVAIKTNSITVNDLYHQPVQISNAYHICPIIIFDNSMITKYKRVICLDNEEKTIVNIFSLSDYKAMMETLVHPYDIIYYLQQRTLWLTKTQSLPCIALGDSDNISIISKIDTERDFASFFDKLVYEGNSIKKENALRLLAIINKFRENQIKKCPEYKTILHLLQKIKPQTATGFVERFKSTWDNACNGIIDYSKAVCVMEENRKTSIVFFSANADIAKQSFYELICDAKQQQHQVDAVLLIVFKGESKKECSIDWVYFEKPFIEEPEVLNEYKKLGLIPSDYTIEIVDS